MVLPQKHKAEPLETNASGESHSFMIDVDNFKKQLTFFYTHWKKHKMDFWRGCDVLSITVSPSSDAKSSAFSRWLLGYQVTPLVMVFLEKRIHFFCAEEKISLPESLKIAAREAVNVELSIHLGTKSDDQVGFMDEILKIIHDQCRSDGCELPVGGFMLEESPEGKILEILAEKWWKKFHFRDIAEGFSELWLEKNSTQLTDVKKAASLVAYVMEHFVAPRCHDIAWKHLRFNCSQSELIDEMEEFIFDLGNKELRSFREVMISVLIDEVEPERIELCHRPIFQRGYGFSLDDLSLEMYDWDLWGTDTGVVISKIALRYNGYCSNIARTFLIRPHPAQLKAFGVLCKAQKAAIGALKPGNKVSAAYQEAISVVQKEGPEFAVFMTSSVGTGIGLEFCEAGLRLDSSNDRVLKSGMVFNVSLGFENVHAETNNPMTKFFSLLLADTVVVNEVAAETLTVVRLKGEFGYIHRDTQRYLPASLLISHNQYKSDNVRKLGIGFDIDYASNLSPSRKLSVQVKQEMNAVLVPIRQNMVPLHISSIRSADNDHRPDLVTIKFNSPRLASHSYGTDSKQVQPSCYLAEIEFPSGDRCTAKKVVQEINALKQQFCLRELKRAKLAGSSGGTGKLWEITEAGRGYKKHILIRQHLSSSDEEGGQPMKLQN